MTPNLLNVKKIGKSKYLINYQENNEIKLLEITEERFWIEEVQEYLSIFNSDNSVFYEIWGYTDFKKSVSAAIADLRTKSPQLQAA